MIDMDGQTQSVEQNFDHKPQQLSLLDLENMTFKAYVSIDSLKEQLKQKKEMITDGYKNSHAFQERNQDVINAKKALLQVKAEVDKVPGVKVLQDEAKDLKQRIKDKKAELSANAVQYAEEASTDLIDRDGVMYKIVRTAKLVKASSSML